VTAYIVFFACVIPGCLLLVGVAGRGVDKHTKRRRRS
jgi:hypothetical protein